MTERNRYVLSCRGRHLHLTDSVLVGRSDTCDLVLHRDDEASRIHARLFLEEGLAYVEDLHSTNGVYVGGERIVGRRRISLHDSIRIGTSLIAVCEAVADEASAQAQEPFLGSRPVGDDPTRPTDVFAVLESAALKAIRGGDPMAAERLASAHLLKVRHELEQNSAEDDHVEIALRIAEELASALSSPVWLDYLIEMYTLLRRSMPSALVDLLYAAAPGKGVRSAGLRAYCHRLGQRYDTLTAMQRMSVVRLQNLLPRLESA